MKATTCLITLFCYCIGMIPLEAAQRSNEDYINVLANPVDPYYEPGPEEYVVRLPQDTKTACYDKDRKIHEGKLRAGEFLIGTAEGRYIFANRIYRCGNPLVNPIPIENPYYATEKKNEKCELDFLNSFTLALGSGLTGYAIGDEKDWAGWIGGGLLATYAYQAYKDPKERSCRIVKNTVLGLISVATGYLIGRHQKNIRDQHQEDQRLAKQNPPVGPGPLPPPAPQFVLGFNSASTPHQPSHLEVQTGIGFDTRIGIRVQYRF